MKVSDETWVADSHVKTCLFGDPDFHNESGDDPCSSVNGRLSNLGRDDGSVGRYDQGRRMQNRSAGCRAFARDLQ